jgi:adenylosuccinate synthase
MSTTSAVADLILGIQWGDEGKGRVVDAYANQGYDIVARFGGGDNAGHSIVVGEQKIALHIVPSGALVDGVELFIGGGTVIGLKGLIKELDMLAGIGVDISRVRISDRAHLVFPYHAALDRLGEKARGDDKIGTTGRGIGPAYVDRVARVGVPFSYVTDPAQLKLAIERAYTKHAAALAGDDTAPSLEEILTETLELAQRVRPNVVDGVEYIHNALRAGKRILIEGAQGTLLDVAYGTYPYVTSSATIAGGACTGLGIGPKAIGQVIGIAKAYCTRVGSGPFPSELENETGEWLRKQGREFGVTTGRPRRCGWFDMVAARYAVAVNGLDSIVMTKLDVLSGMDKIGVVVGYTVDGHDIGFAAINHPNLKTKIEWYDGWTEDIGHIRRIVDLPTNAQAYLKALAKQLEVPIIEVSVGPERSAAAR